MSGVFKSMSSLDELLTRLDSLWNLCKVPTLVDLLSELPEAEHDAKTELCAADLEWRWRMSERCHLQPNLVTASKLTIRPSACEYSILLGESWHRKECRQRMTESEWIARSAWGDKPHIDEFVGHDSFRRSLSNSLVEQLDLIVPMKLRVSMENDVVLEIGNFDSLTFGRQNPWEPSPPAWIPESRRLVIADLAQKTFSREQGRLKRVKARELEIINLSSKAVLSLYLCALGPGESFRFTVPFDFAINTFRIITFVTEMG